MTAMSEADVQRIAHAAAREAVEQVFLTIGADISTPEAIIQIQEDFRHIRRRREIDQAIGRRAIFTLISLVIGVILAIIFEKIGLNV
jgi:uncharacterized protein YoaH (UPF0181 family)